MHSHFTHIFSKSTERVLEDYGLLGSNCVKHLLPEKEKVFSVLWSLTSRYWWLQCKYSRNIYLYFIYMKIWCALESDLSLRSIRRGWGGLASSYASAVLVMSLCFKYSHYDGRCCPYGELLSWFNYEQLQLHAISDCIGHTWLCAWVILIITAALTWLTSHTIHIISHELIILQCLISVKSHAECVTGITDFVLSLALFCLRQKKKKSIVLCTVVANIEPLLYCNRWL